MVIQETVAERQAVTYDIASALLEYDPISGKLRWLSRSAEMFKSCAACRSWNSRLSGKEALNSIGSNGQLFGSIFGRKYKAHRVIWLIATGDWPTGVIDHINGNPTDNRLSNLRDVSNAENLKNASLSKGNTSGFCGVHWHSKNKKWQAKIGVAGRTVHLGYFDSVVEAANARAQANSDFGYSSRHGQPAPQMEAR